jgi:multiple sugar transport system permease protein
MEEMALHTIGEKVWSKIRVNWREYLIDILLGVPLVGGMILMLLPFVWTISFSFGLPQEFFELPPPIVPSALRLDNYRAVFERVDFLTFFMNSVIVSVTILIGRIVTCSMAAYAFARLRFPGRDFIFTVFLASMMVPGQVTLIPNFIIIREIGLYNSLGALIVPGLTGIFGFFLLRQFFETIPDELEDAAKIDGAGFFHIFWKIMFPLVLPAVATLSILTFNGTWNNFFGPLIFINSQSKMTLPLGMIFLSNQQGVVSSGIIMAAVVLNLIPVFLVFMIFQRRLVAGITMTGLKGV